jgi:Short C-terminal domain
MSPKEQRAKALRGEVAGTAFIGGNRVSSASQAQPTVVDQLTMLAELREHGALTDAEFEQQKAKLLSDSRPGLVTRQL